MVVIDLVVVVLLYFFMFVVLLGRLFLLLSCCTVVVAVGWCACSQSCVSHLGKFDVRICVAQCCFSDKLLWEALGLRGKWLFSVSRASQASFRRD